MIKGWVVVLLLGMAGAATAQESYPAQFQRVDPDALPASLAEEFRDRVALEEQDKDKKQDQTITITADKLDDELPVGPYRRPKWTLHRVSPTTRIYLQVDPGEVEFEQWLDIRLRKKRSQPDDRIRFAEEFEFGLGGRFQLDLYYNTIFSRNNGQNATLSIRSWAAELRWALADWGVIPGNPTLYFEYIIWNNDPAGHGDEATSSIEPKLLFGGEFARGWHWGLNLFYEKTLNDSVKEHGITYSIIHTVVDEIFSAGLTAKFVYEVDEVTGGAKERSRELYLGPSFQFRMARIETEMEVNGVKTKMKRAKAHLDIEPIFGLTGDSSRVQLLLVFGWDF